MNVSLGEHAAVQVHFSNTLNVTIISVHYHVIQRDTESLNTLTVLTDGYKYFIFCFCRTFGSVHNQQSS